MSVAVQLHLVNISQCNIAHSPWLTVTVLVLPAVHDAAWALPGVSHFAEKCCGKQLLGKLLSPSSLQKPECLGLVLKHL